MKRTLVLYFTMVAGFLGVGAAYHYDKLPLPDMREWTIVDHWISDPHNMYHRPYRIRTQDGVNCDLRFAFEWYEENASRFWRRTDIPRLILDIELRKTFYNVMRARAKNTKAADLPAQIDTAIAAWKNAQEMCGVEFRQFEYKLVMPDNLNG